MPFILAFLTYQAIKPWFILVDENDCLYHRCYYIPLQVIAKRENGIGKAYNNSLKIT
jgi:hypothetical protein